MTREPVGLRRRMNRGERLVEFFNIRLGPSRRPDLALEPAPVEYSICLRLGKPFFGKSLKRGFSGCTKIVRVIQFPRQPTLIVFLRHYG